MMSDPPRPPGQPPDEPDPDAPVPVEEPPQPIPVPPMDPPHEPLRADRRGSLPAGHFQCTLYSRTNPSADGENATPSLNA
jgi:hypothetical protein